MLIKEVIIEKFKNFLNFLKSKLADNNHEVIDKYLETPVEFIIEYIKANDIPLKHDLDMFIIKLSNEYNIPYDKITPKDKDKLKKYLQFFIEIVSNLL